MEIFYYTIIVTTDAFDCCGEEETMLTGSRAETGCDVEAAGASIFCALRVWPSAAVPNGVIVDESRVAGFMTEQEACEDEVEVDTWGEILENEASDTEGIHELNVEMVPSEAQGGAADMTEVWCTSGSGGDNIGTLDETNWLAKTSESLADSEVLRECVEVTSNECSKEGTLKSLGSKSVSEAAEVATDSVTTADGLVTNGFNGRSRSFCVTMSSWIWWALFCGSNELMFWSRTAVEIIICWAPKSYNEYSTLNLLILSKIKKNLKTNNK